MIMPKQSMTFDYIGLPVQAIAGTKTIHSKPFHYHNLLDILSLTLVATLVKPAFSSAVAKLFKLG